MRNHERTLAKRKACVHALAHVRVSWRSRFDEDEEEDEAHYRVDSATKGSEDEDDPLPRTGPHEDAHAHD